MLVNARDFLIKEAMIDNHYEIKYTKDQKRIERLYCDCPPWLMGACRDAVANFFIGKQNESISDYHFAKLGGSLSLPYDQEWRWSILLEDSLGQLEKKRLNMVCAWLHTERALWYKQTADLNKAAKKKSDWILSPMTSTKLSEWPDDACRQISVVCGRHILNVTRLMTTQKKNDPSPKYLGLISQ